MIVRFLRFPERELGFRIVRELTDDIDIKVYADFPKEIGERRKSSGRVLKKAREEGKIVFFSKPEPDKLFIDGRFVSLETNLGFWTQFILIDLFILFIRLFL